MINRRLIRIKVFKVLYSSVINRTETIKSSEKELIMSFEKTRELYFFMLNILVALTKVADDKIEAGLKKFHPTPEEKNPNRKFVDNLVVKRIVEDGFSLSFCEKKGLIWSTDDLKMFTKKLYNNISKKDYFIQYMNSGIHSLEEDCNLCIRIFEEEFDQNEELASTLEDMSLYWIDDLVYDINVVIRNIAHLRKKNELRNPSLFLKDDDREYAIDLLDYALSKYDDILKIVSDKVIHWDEDRLVTTDITIIILGVAEAMRFPNIPIKVTINEYVEISKYYSTPKSKVFVNGLLDKIIGEMVSDSRIVKAGRGLIDSSIKAEEKKNNSQDLQTEEPVTKKKRVKRTVKIGAERAAEKAAESDSSKNLKENNQE